MEEQAKEFCKENIVEIIEWITPKHLKYDYKAAKYYLITPKGEVYIACGDMIFKDIFGDFWAYSLKEKDKRKG